MEQVFWVRCHVRKQFQLKEVKGIYLHLGNSWVTSCRDSGRKPKKLLGKVKRIQANVDILSV